MECEHCEGISFLPVIEHEVKHGKEVLVECIDCRHWQIRIIPYRKVDPNQEMLL